jgi:hypothetical protein
VGPWFYQYTLSLTTGEKSFSDIPDKYDNQRNFADTSETETPNFHSTMNTEN